MFWKNTPFGFDVIDPERPMRYAVVGDFGSRWGWVVDWQKYKAVPWWRRLFAPAPV